MPKAGAAGGVTPAVPANNTLANNTPAGAQGGTAESKSSAPPLPETSGRALPEAEARTAPKAAVALAATLAGLRVAQDVRGTVRLLPGQLHALLTTPQGDFLISPATGLEADSEVSLVLTRADRAISALLLTADGKTLDPPRPVALTLIAVRGDKAHAAPVEKQGGSAPVPPLTPAPARPTPALLAAAQTSGLTSLLPGEAVTLRGSGTVALPQTSLPQTSLPQPPLPQMALPAQGAAQVARPVPLPAGTPSEIPSSATATTSAPRALLHGLVLSDMPRQAAPAPGTPVALANTDPVAALFERGALALTLHSEHSGQPRKQTLTANLLGSAAPGERTPLTHPPASSPLARLAEAGRLITATVLPTETDAAPAPGRTVPASVFAPAPQATVTSPAQRPAMQQAVIQASVQTGVPDASGVRLDLPAGTPAPAPGTQLVFLVTKGHEALRAQTAAQPSAQPATQPGAPAPAATATPTPAPVAPQAAPAAHINPQTGQPTAPTVAASAPTRAEGTAATAPAGATTTPTTASTAKAAAHTAPAPANTPAPAAPDAAAPPQNLLWVPGMILPAGAVPAAPNPATATPGEALLMAIMQALGRKGFNARPNGGPPAAPAQGDADGTSQAAPPLARVAQVPQGAARAESAPESTLLAAALPGPLPSTAPEAAPLALTLQTPQGPIPLLFLVWHPVRDEENDKGNAARNNGEQDVCFAVDVRFDSLGLLRLRGAVNPKHLQLAVETEHPLGDALEHSATQDFLHAIEAGGMTGTLTFRHRGYSQEGL